MTPSNDREQSGGLDHLLRQMALPRPESAELRRVRARLTPRIAARRKLISRATALGVPLVTATALAWPAWHVFRGRQEPLAPAFEAPTRKAEPVVEPAAAPVLVAPVVPRVEPTTGVKHVHHAVAPDAPAAVRDTLADETTALASAIARLRQKGDPAGALRALELYRQTYPQANFASEVRVLRVEALIALGRRTEALTELSPNELPSLPRSEELWVVRGEILLELKRPEEALGAFDAALRGAKTDALVERALRGRAAAQRSLAH